MPAAGCTTVLGRVPWVWVVGVEVVLGTAGPIASLLGLKEVEGEISIFYFQNTSVQCSFFVNIMRTFLLLYGFSKVIPLYAMSQ